MMKLTREELVREKETSPLELFYQGIKADETREKYSCTLRQVLCKMLEDILEGTFEERVTQLVRYGRQEPQWTRDMLLSLSCMLRQQPNPRTTTHPNGSRLLEILKDGQKPGRLASILGDLPKIQSRQTKKQIWYISKNGICKKKG